MADNSVNRSIKIFINQKEIENNMKSIEAEFFKARNEVKLLTRGTQEYNDKMKEVARLKAILNDHTNQINGASKAWSNFKVIFLATLGSNLMENFFSRIAAFFPELIRGAGDLEDQFADIRKTTGMTDEEVRKLNADLMSMDTRTAADQLREMAIVAGQLGIAKEDVFGFVRGVDQLNVALGDEFSGGAAQIADEVGRLRNVFSDFKSDNVEQDMLKIGNAINVLGSEGMATGPVITDFANRIGGVGIPLGLSTGQVLGMSAAMQELSIDAERGGTAITKILQHMSQDVDSFALIAGMSTQKFTELVNTDLYGALKAVLDGTKNNSGSATMFAQILEKLQLTGSGASEVFSKLSGNIDFLDKKVISATRSLSETDSVVSEFNVKNATLGAVLDKLGKDVASIFTSDFVVGAVKSFFGVFISGIDMVKQNAEVLKALGKTVLVVAAGFASWFATMKLKVLYDMIKGIIAQNVAATNMAASLTGATRAQILFAGATNTVKNAWNGLKAAFVSNPFGFLLISLQSIVMLLELFSDEVDHVAQQQRDFENAMQKHNAVYEQQAAAINGSMNAALDRVGVDDKLKASIEAINKKYGLHIEFTANDVEMTKRLVEAKTLLIEKLNQEHQATSNLENLKSTDKNIKEAEAALQQMMKDRTAMNMFDPSGGLIGKLFGPSDDDVKTKINEINQLRKSRTQLIADIEADKNAGYQNKAGAKKGNLNLSKPTKGKDKPDFDLDIDKLFAELLKAEEKYRNAVADNLKKSNDEVIKIQREARYDEMKGYALLEAHVKDKYIDMAEAAKECFEDQTKTFQEAEEKQLEGIKKLELENKKALKDGVISSAEYGNNQTKLETARKKVKEQFNLVYQEMERRQGGVMINLQKAQAAEEALLKKQTFKQVMKDYKEMVKENLKDIRDLQIAATDFRAQLAIQKLQFDKAREEIRLSNKLALDKEVQDITDSYDERIKKAKEMAVQLALVDKPAEAQAALDEAVNLEIMKQTAIDQIKQEFLQKGLNDQLDVFAQQIDMVQGFVNKTTEIYKVYETSRNNKDAAELSRTKHRIKGEQVLLDEQLKNKVITQAEYNSKKIALENELKAKENQIMIRQFKRQQRADFIQSLINGALATSRALASPPGPPFNLPTVILTGVLAAAQSAMILSQKPPEYGKGTYHGTGNGKYFDSGPKHKDPSGGLWVMNPETGKVEATFERGEMLLSEATVNNNPELVWPLLQASQSGGGKRIVEDIVPQIDVPTAMTNVQKYQKGTYFGSVDPLPGSRSGGSGAAPDPAMVQMISEGLRANAQAIENLSAEIGAFDREKEVFVKQTKLEEADKDEKLRKQLASLKQTKTDDGTRLLS